MVAAVAGCGVPEPAPTLIDASLPEPVYVGDPVTIAAEVDNDGGAGRAVLSLTVDGKTVARKRVELGRAERATVEFRHTFDDPGEYEIGIDGERVGTIAVQRAIVVESVEIPDAVILEAPARVRITFRNRASTTQSATRRVKLGDRTAERVAEVEGGSTLAVRSTLYPQRPGEYPVSVDGEQVGTVRVAPAWPQFGVGSGNAGAAPWTAGPGGDGAPSPAWSRGRADGLGSSPAVADGVVYVGGGNPYGADDSGTLLALGADDGSPRWQTETPGPVYGAPAVVGDLVVVGTTDGTLREVDDPATLPGSALGLSADDGEILWSADIGAPVLGAPAVHRGTAYLTTADGGVHAFDPETGKRRWSRSLAASAVASPAVGDGAVYVGTLDGRLLALEPTDGATTWTYEVDGQVRYAPTLAGEVIYAVVTRYGVSGGSSLHAIGVDGSRRWHRDYDVSFASSVTAGSAGLAASVGINTWGLDPADGRIRWRGLSGDAGSSGGAPAIADGVVYAGVGRTNGGLLRAYDAASGERLWTLDGRFAGVAPAVLDGTLYATRGFGEVVALR